MFHVEHMAININLKTIRVKSKLWWQNEIANSMVVKFMQFGCRYVDRLKFTLYISVPRGTLIWVRFLLL